MLDTILVFEILTKFLFRMNSLQLLVISLNKSICFLLFVPAKIVETQEKPRQLYARFEPIGTRKQTVS